MKSWPYTAGTAGGPAHGAEDEILSVKGVAGYLKVTERTVSRLTQEGRLLGFKGGNARRFRLRNIDAWIEAQKAEVRRDGGRR
ncbi:MAG TPA: DNA-binding protein [Myxococcales bacterium]|nr:DNA-binding protein [Myxococcales bacterium]